MKRYVLEDDLVYYEAPDMVSMKGLDFFEMQRRLDDFDNAVKKLVSACLAKRGFPEILEEYRKVHGLAGYTLLHAHRVNMPKEEEWRFFDGERKLSMQKWVEKRDGNCLAMILVVCNTDNNEIETERSIVIHPKKRVNIQDILNEECLRIYVPGRGYCEA